MSGPFGSQQWMYASGGFYSHPIDQSLRFNDDDSAYLSRTPASVGNRKTWTWSGWVKRGNLDSGSNDQILFAGRDGSNNLTIIGWYQDRLNFTFYAAPSVTGEKKSTAVYRDSSAHYHVVAVCDTTNATAADRMRIYVNGVRITSFSASTDPALNYDAPAFNTTNAQGIGWVSTWPISAYLDGYMAEVNFIDGQALDPTDFGEFKSGVWIPKRYSGSYGTNGFYLDFGNSGTLGADSSGNSNNWTPTNLVATDQVIDSPTNNFATLNQINRNSTLTLAEGNLSLTSTAAQGAGCGVTMATSSGKWYYETVYVSGVSSYIHVGVIDSDATVAQLNTTNTAVNGTIYRGDGKIYENSGSGWSVTQTVTAASTGDIIGVAYDLDAQTCTYYLNNTQLGSSVSISYMNPEVMPYPLFGYYTAVMALNFGQDSSFAGQKTAQGNTDANGIGDFYYAPPSGYLALCTANLPDPDIDPAQDDVPEDYFNTVLYTGNGSTQSVTGVGFQPDFIWLKSRSQAYDHGLVDAVRGVTKFLESNTTDAEATAANYTTSFDSDGFSLGVNNRFNQSSATNVAWNWKADGSGVSNTDGTITSTVSANQKAGFSIVSYTGTGSSATVGHGLSSAPEMVFYKSRDAARNWLCLTTAIDGSNDYGYLNLTNAFGNASQAVPTSTVLGVGAGGDENTSGEKIIAYCFHSVEGYSKFGSYTGNGSTDGPFVYCGFRPAFVIFRRTNNTGNWIMFDSVRGAYNINDNSFFANDSSAEATSATDGVDFLSNGIKIRNTYGSDNGSGDTYIFMAFAEMPFKYANAR